MCINIYIYSIYIYTYIWMFPLPGCHSPPGLLPFLTSGIPLAVSQDLGLPQETKSMIHVSGKSFSFWDILLLIIVFVGIEGI